MIRRLTKCEFEVVGHEWNEVFGHGSMKNQYSQKDLGT